MFPNDKDIKHDTTETPDVPVEETAQPETPAAEEPAAQESADIPTGTGTPAATPESSISTPQSSIVANLAKLEAEIRALDSGHLKDNRRNYKEFWEHAKQIGALFKSLKPLPYDERERLWMEFSALCDDVRAQQTHEKEELKFTSQEIRTNVESRVATLREQAQGAIKAQDFNTIASELTKIRAKFSTKPDQPQNLLARDRETLWKLWKAADDEVWAKRLAARKENYEQGKQLCSQCLSLVEQEKPIECHRKIKELRPWQREVELSREQRDEIRKALDAAWDAATAKIQGQHADRQKHFEEWTEKSEGLLEEWGNKAEKMREFRGRLLEQIERLNEMETNARTDEFAAQVAGWKTDKQQKLDHVDETIAQLEQKIESVKKRLKK